MSVTPTRAPAPGDRVSAGRSFRHVSASSAYSSTMITSAGIFLVGSQTRRPAPARWLARASSTATASASSCPGLVSGHRLLFDDTEAGGLADPMLLCRAVESVLNSAQERWYECLDGSRNRLPRTSGPLICVLAELRDLSAARPAASSRWHWPVLRRSPKLARHYEAVTRPVPTRVPRPPSCSVAVDRRNRDED